MTRDDAEKALEAGKRLTHTAFSEHEWVECLDKDNYLFEDGCHCSKAEFWNIRPEAWWNIGWREYYVPA